MNDAMLGDVIGVGAMELVYRMPHAATASMFGVLGMPPLQLRSSVRVVSRWMTTTRRISERRPAMALPAGTNSDSARANPTIRNPLRALDAVL